MEPSPRSGRTQLQGNGGQEKCETYCQVSQASTPAVNIRGPPAVQSPKPLRSIAPRGCRAAQRRRGK